MIYYYLEEGVIYAINDTKEQKVRSVDAVFFGISIIELFAWPDRLAMSRMPQHNQSFQVRQSIG